MVILDFKKQMHEIFKKMDIFQIFGFLKFGTKMFGRKYLKNVLKRGKYLPFVMKTTKTSNIET